MYIIINKCPSASSECTQYLTCEIEYYVHTIITNLISHKYSAVERTTFLYFCDPTLYSLDTNTKNTYYFQ